MSAALPSVVASACSVSAVPSRYTSKSSSGQAVPDFAASARQEVWLRKYAGTLPLASQVCYCCKSVALYSVAEVRVKDGRAFYAGLKLCRDVWVCPTCSYLASRRRSRQLGTLVRAGMSLGYRVVMLTYTFSHHKDDRLSDIRARFYEALSKSRSGRAYADLRRKYEPLGFVRGSEVMYGRNGWHPHVHELWFLPPGCDVAAFARDMEAAYLAALDKCGLSANEHGLRVDTADERISRYVAKFGRQPKWGVAREVANGRRKAGKGSETPWQLLARAAAGDDEARSLFIEYAEAYRGVRQLYVSPGLAQALGFVDMDDARAVSEGQADEVAGSETVLRLTTLQLNCIIRADMEAEVLIQAVRLSPADLLAFVDGIVARWYPSE